MAKTVADFMIERLRAWGVRRIYGYPGDGITGLVAAIDRAGEHMQLVQVRHEESAAFMASAHAKLTGELGVCLATSGPGAIHLLNGLYDARMDHAPVLAIMGQSARMALGTDYTQEVDLHSLFKDVAREYVQDCVHPAQARHLVDRAVRIALGERTVTALIVPHDVQVEAAIELPPHEHDVARSGVGYRRPVLVPLDEDLDAAAKVLNAGEQIAILVGAGALGARAEVEAIADALGAGVAKALLGKAAMPDTLPYVTGSIGLLGTEATDQMMRHCDTLLMIGSSFPYAEFLPEVGQAKGVQIDIAARQLSLRFPMDVALQGDAAPTLRALLPKLRARTSHAWREQVETWTASSKHVLAAQAAASAEPVNAQHVFAELSKRLPDRAILLADTGTCSSWWARHLEVRDGMLATLSGTLATMGPAVPYALAAKLAFPDRPVIAAVGDGAMQMLGNTELPTIAAHCASWPNRQLVIVVLDNGDLNMVTWEQRVIGGVPKFPTSQDLPPFDYAAYAELCGLRGIRVTTPEAVGPAIDAALAADRPTVIAVKVDPNTPQLPPHVSVEQAKHFFLSLVKGDPERSGVIAQTAKQLWASLKG